MQRIDGNNQVLRPCYRTDIGGAGASKLKTLQAAHATLTEEVESKVAELDVLAVADPTLRDPLLVRVKKELWVLRDEWELSRALQVDVGSEPGRC